jgi:hypothetical protein
VIRSERADAPSAVEHTLVLRPTLKHARSSCEDALTIKRTVCFGDTRRVLSAIMEGGKLNMSLDAIIEKETKGGRRVPRRSSATAMDTGSRRGPKDGVRKSGGRRQPPRQAAKQQTSGRTLRPRRRNQGCDQMQPTGSNAFVLAAWP